MRRLLVVLTVLSSACATTVGHHRPYQTGDLKLVTAYTAKETCSCLFVMNQSEEFCRAWTKAAPNVASWKVDTAAKTVESSALLFWSGRARFVSDHDGCVLE